MSDRELTQLISTAKHYLDAADSLCLPDQDLTRTVSANAAAWSADKLSHPLSPLDAYSAHLASCATRLATIHEILVGGTEKAWAIAYPNNAAVSDDNLKSATSKALEILLRDNVAHAEAPSTKGLQRSAFRNAALGPLTFKDMSVQLRLRYHALAERCVHCENA